jgi:hypothetical protein
VWTIFVAVFAIVPLRSIRKAKSEGAFRWGWESRRPIEGNEGFFRSWLFFQWLSVAGCVLFTAIAILALFHVISGGS